ncbi:invasion associated locus B family protein [Devosia sp.]|jgi:invasion protein IalB|uniref:invasion associated locus B family protein n=1 Tax=Devosia sp. TaxID=1871048 RepID=UPI0037BF5720
MRKILLVAAALFLALPATAQDVSASLPGGAKSLSEEHGDWTVSCRAEDGKKLCVMAQALADGQSGQQVLAVELATPTIDQAEGMFLLPFGLRLADGVKLQVDGSDLAAPRTFLTCIASGCLVPVSFDAAQVSAIRSGKELQIVAASADTGEPVQLKISLAGFSRAANRSVELGL